MSSSNGRFLTAEWRWLVVASWEVDLDLVAGLAPPATTPDTWQGRAMVSLVAFRFLRARLLGIPVPLHRSFNEVNVRTYVRRDAPEGPRHGVTFIREIVPLPAVAWVARLSHGEPYVSRRMRHDVVAPERPGGDGRFAYEWRHAGRWHHARARVGGEPAVPAEGSREAFLLGRPWGYSARASATWEYRVDRPAWRAWSSPALDLDADLAGLVPGELARQMRRPPDSAIVAEGSPVVVRRGAPVAV